MDAFVTRKKRRAAENGDEGQINHEENDLLKRSKSDLLKTDLEDKLRKPTHDKEHCQYKSWNDWVTERPLKWKQVRAENLDCDYTLILSRDKAHDLFQLCEKNLTYNTGRMAQVQIFGKWLDIPRKQVAFGDEGLTYTFSKNEVPARPWPPFLESLRDAISHVSGHKFNFVLVNRYANGNDHIGEHRDDERDLVRTSPIASLSLGQERDFIFKHADSRGKDAKRPEIATVSLSLEHGSLLLMKYPTNIHWYHALPKRKRAPGVRINLTFRDFVTNKK